MNGLTMALVMAALVLGVLGLTIYMSRPNWPYHTGGSAGYIRDLIIYTFLPAVPAFFLVLGFQIYTRVQQQPADQNISYVLIAVALLSLVIMRRMPFVTAAQNRVRDARSARYQASGS